MSIFNRKLTKWIPLAVMVYSGTETLIMVRGNKKTGQLYFKRILTNAWSRTSGLCHHVLPSGLLDVTKQWNEIMSKINDPNN